MKNLLYIIIVALILTGCGAIRVATSSDIQEVKNDSVRIEYREKIVFVPDTVFVEIPAQTAERTTLDSLSHLENEYAESDARINQDGSLFHDLKTKPQTKPLPTKKEIQYRDSIVYKDRIVEVKIRETETVEVEKKLSWFQKTQIIGFWLMIVVALIKNRRNLLPFIRRLF